MNKTSGFMLSLKSLYKVDKDYEDNFTPRYVVPCQRGMKCCSKGSSETHHVHSDVVPDKRKTSMVSSFSQTDYRNIFSPPQRQTETAKRKEEKTVENSSKDETLDPDTDEIDCFKSTISILSPIPPPPPPPPALINGMKMSPVGHYSSVMELRKPAVIPKTPMTPIFWKRLLISEQEDSIWNSINLDVSFDEEEFCELFGKQSGLPGSFRKSESLSSVDSNSGIRKTHLLDGKKSKTLAILLHGQRLDIEDVKTALATLETEDIPVEILQTVYDQRPTETELKTIQEYLQSVHTAPLDRPEKFVFELSRISDYQERLWVVIFCSQFPEKLDTISRKIITFDNVCETFLWSSQLHKLLGYILTLGNYMNGGNRYRGQADGFSIEILPKLKDVKSQKAGETFLDFVCRECEKNDPNDNLVGNIPDPLDCLEAASFKADFVATEIQQLKINLETFRLKVEQIFKETDNNEDLFSRMKENYTKGRLALEEITINLERARESWDRVSNFYGIRVDGISSEDFFKIWSSFVHDIHHSSNKTSSRSPFGLL